MVADRSAIIARATSTAAKVETSRDQYVANGGIATHAARDAGYADCAAIGSRLLKRRYIREEIGFVSALLCLVSTFAKTKAIWIP